MDPAWRIRKQYGKGRGRLVLGFARRRDATGKLGLRAGLRRFGRELPFRGPLALVALGAVLAAAMTFFRGEVAYESDLLVTLLDAPEQVEQAERVASAPKPEPKPETASLDASDAVPPHRDEPRAPRPVQKTVAPSPQIDPLANIALAPAPADTTQKPPRTSARVAAAPARPEGALPVLPAVSAVGPAAGRRPVRAGAAPRRSGPPKPVPAASGGGFAAVPVAPAAHRGGVSVRNEADDETGRRDPGVAGVPLGSLASCLSDRREDALKQRVVARVPEPTTCESGAGTYRFLETKNVNAFLMWIERASHRSEADRCAELTLAIDCLSHGVVTKETNES